MIESRAATAKSETERFNAAQDMNFANQEFERQKFNETMNAPKVHSGGGYLTVQQIDPDTGKWVVNSVDMNLSYKQAVIAARAASGPDKIFFKGKEMDASVVKNLGPITWELVTGAQELIVSGHIFGDDWTPYMDAAVQRVTDGRVESLDELVSTGMGPGYDQDLYNTKLEDAVIMAMQLRQMEEAAAARAPAGGGGGGGLMDAISPFFGAFPQGPQ